MNANSNIFSTTPPLQNFVGFYCNSTLSTNFITCNQIEIPHSTTRKYSKQTRPGQNLCRSLYRLSKSVWWSESDSANCLSGQPIIKVQAEIDKIRILMCVGGLLLVFPYGKINKTIGRPFLLCICFMSLFV